METHGAEAIRHEAGEGLITDMRAVRKDYFLDHDHSAYVDQWDWELAITSEQRTLRFLKASVEKIWKVIKGAEVSRQRPVPTTQVRLASGSPRRAYLYPR